MRKLLKAFKNSSSPPPFRSPPLHQRPVGLWISACARFLVALGGSPGRSASRRLQAVPRRVAGCPWRVASHRLLVACPTKKLLKNKSECLRCFGFFLLFFGLHVVLDSRSTCQRFFANRKSCTLGRPQGLFGRPRSRFGPKTAPSSNNLEKVSWRQNFPITTWMHVWSFFICFVPRRVSLI